VHPWGPLQGVPS